MPLLYYWRRDNYEHDLDFGVGYHLNQASARLHDIDEGPGLAAERRSYLYETSVSRARQHTQALRERYQDRCQLCAWCGREHYRHALCEAHHIQWISRGGADAPDNLVLLCPNHHRAVHAADAVLDFADMAFVFEEGRREVLREPGHLVG